MDIMAQVGEWCLYDDQGQIRHFDSEESMKRYIYEELPNVRQIVWSDNPHGF
jgi:hypothetical protein